MGDTARPPANRVSCVAWPPATTPGTRAASFACPCPRNDFNLSTTGPRGGPAASPGTFGRCYR
eukprot:5542829-Pyramimonas_sp.AAC.1